MDKIIDARGNETEWLRDVQKRVTSKKIAGQTVATYVYETTTSRLHSITDVANQVTSLALRMSTTIERIEKRGDTLAVHVSNGDVLEADCVLFATGRAPNTAKLGLESVGVQRAESGAIVVDKHYRSSVESIFAIGDATDTPALTPVALALSCSRWVAGEARPRYFALLHILAEPQSASPET